MCALERSQTSIIVCTLLRNHIGKLLLVGRNQMKLQPLAKNTIYSHKNDNPYCTGSRGYAKKVPKQEKKLQELFQKGVTPKTHGQDARSLRYLLARGMTYNDDGSLNFPSDAVCELSIKIEALQSQEADGTFVPNREDDILTRALWNKEHPSRT